MHVLLNIIKHLLLFALCNVLGLFFIFISDDIISVVSTLGASIALSIIAMGFTFIPYFFSITFIKNSKHSPLWGYMLGGAMSPFFLYIFILASGHFVACMVIAISGAISGLLYGILDKTIQIPAKQRYPIMGDGNG